MVRQRVVTALQNAFSGQLNKAGVIRETSWISVGGKVAENARSEKAKLLLSEYADMLNMWKDREVRSHSI